MPNHVTNRITTDSNKLTQFITNKVDYTGEKYKQFDFNLIITRPEIYDKYNTTTSNIKMAAEIALGLIDFKSEDILINLHANNCKQLLNNKKMAANYSDEEFDQFIICLNAYRLYGYLDWYDWNVANWDTKWNSYNLNIINDRIITFETAWSAPHKVIKKLQKKLNCSLTHEWADEDTGVNVGKKVYAANGCLITDEEYSNTKQGYELAFELCGGAEYYRWNGNEYEYRS